MPVQRPADGSVRAASAHQVRVADEARAEDGGRVPLRAPQALPVPLLERAGAELHAGRAAAAVREREARAVEARAHDARHRRPRLPFRDAVQAPERARQLLLGPDRQLLAGSRAHLQRLQEALVRCE